MLNSKLNLDKAQGNRNPRCAGLLIGLLLLALAAPLFGQNPTPLLTQSEDQLIAALKSDASQKEKIDACRQLAVIGTKEAVPALVALLGDEKLSHMARYGLEPIPDPSVDEALRNAAFRFKGKLLVGVIGSIGVRRDGQAVRILTGKLYDSDADVVRAAAGSLGQIGTLAAGKALQEAWANTPAPRYLMLAEGMLRCAEALAAKGMRSDALAIYDCLRDAQAPHQVRAGALRGAILNRQEEGLSLLSKSLHSRDFVVVDAAIRTALEIPGSEVTRILAEQISQLLPTDVEVLIIQALGKRGDANSLWSLHDAITIGTRAKPIRLAAVRALPEIGAPSSVSVLVRTMRDADSEIAQAAQESLAAFPGSEADAVVIRMVESSRANDRLTGIDLVGRRRMMACVPALLKAAGDSDEKVRPAALKRLGELAGPTELPALLDLLTGAKSSPDLDATEQALGAVCARAENPETCVEKLISRLAQAQPAQKSALLRVLGTVGGANALQTVRAAVNDSNPDVHAAAIRALAAWKSVDAAPALLALAQTSSRTADKILCLRSYLDWAAHTDLSADLRLTMCQQAADLVQRNEEKKLLLGALGSIEAPESLALIAHYLDDPAVRQEAGAATLPIVEKLLQGPNGAKLAPKLIEPLQKIVQAAANEDLTKRAKALLQQAQTKASAK